ncbi:MAG: Hsp20 family protein [Candidatus Moranbacteria bacterium]|nr:Hsp20 family protein [Candidatus Moranbacteria bacterium]
MPKTKRSFLAKLIGKTDSDEASYEFAEPGQADRVDFNYERESDQAALGGNYGQVVEPGQDRVSINNNRPNRFMEQRGSEKPQENYQNQAEEPEWSSDQEGQLTIDVYQTETDIVIKSTIAGVKAENLDVQINNDMVTIRGERTQEEQIKQEDYYYQECYWGAFSRSIILPVDIQANKAEANLKNGILTIKLPKASSAQARKIKVRGF